MFNRTLQTNSPTKSPHIDWDATERDCPGMVATLQRVAVTRAAYESAVDHADRRSKGIDYILATDAFKALCDKWEKSEAAKNRMNARWMAN